MRNRVIPNFAICRHCFQNPTHQHDVLATLNTVIQEQRVKNGWTPKSASPSPQSKMTKAAELPIGPVGTVNLSYLLTYLVQLGHSHKHIPADKRREHAREKILKLCVDTTTQEAKEKWNINPEQLEFLKEPEWEAITNA